MRLKSLLTESDHTVTVQLVDDKRKSIGVPIEKVKIVKTSTGYKIKPAGLKTIADAISDKDIEIVTYHFEGKNVIKDGNGKIIAVVLQAEKTKVESKPKPTKKPEKKKEISKPKEITEPSGDILKNFYV